MNELSFSIIDKEEFFKTVELLRLKTYGIKSIDANQYYYDMFINHNMLVYGVFYRDELVGGAYVSSSFQSLFIEQLFVKREFQHNNLHVGSELLKYIINNKKACESFFNAKFDVSRLENRNNDSLYKRFGYKEEDNIYGTMKRRI